MSGKVFLRAVGPWMQRVSMATTRRAKAVPSQKISTLAQRHLSTTPPQATKAKDAHHITIKVTKFEADRPFPKGVALYYLVCLSIATYIWADESDH